MIKADAVFFDALCEKSSTSERKRTIHCFHSTADDRIQRMVNVLEPETYVTPHKHENPDKREVFVLLKGSAVVVEFTENGEISDYFILKFPLQLIAEIAPRIYHCIIPLEKGTAVYELKDGPYDMADDKNFAPWAPFEGDALCNNYTKKLLNQLGL